MGIFSKIIDVVTTPTRKIAEAADNRADKLHDQGNDKWVGPAEVAKAVANVVNGSARAFVGSGGRPDAAVTEAGYSTISEAVKLVTDKNPTMRRLEDKHFGDRKELEKEFEQYTKKLMDEPYEGGKGVDFARKLRDGLLDRDDMDNAVTAFEKFKESGGKMSELKDGQTTKEYLEQKRAEQNKEAETAPKAIPVEGAEQPSGRNNPRFGGRHRGAYAEGALEKQKEIDGTTPNMDTAMAKADGVDKSQFQMTQDGTTLGVANGDPNVGRSAPATRSGEVGLA
jgi:hypothetical protein